MDIHLNIEESEAEYFRRVTGERNAGLAVAKFLTRLARGRDAAERRLASWQPNAAATKRILAITAAIDSRESKKKTANAAQRKRLRTR